MAPRHVSIANALKARFPDELVREIAVFTPYLGPEMATRLGAFWECCWVHGARDIAPEILEELEHLGSVEPEPARTPLPNGKVEAAIAAIDAEAIKPALDPLASPSRSADPGMPAGPQAWRRWRRGTPPNGKPDCATHPRGSGRRTTSSGLGHPRERDPFPPR
jgi:hypothetical protein